MNPCKIYKKEKYRI